MLEIFDLFLELGLFLGEFLLEVVPLFFDEFDLLNDLLVVLVVFDVETSVDLVHLSLVLLLDLSHTVLVLVQLASQFEHLLIFFPVLLTQLLV